MSDIRKLRERQAKIVADAREALEQVTEDTDESRARELEEQFDRAMADYDDLEARIEREERIAVAESSLNEPDPRRPRGDGEARGIDEPKVPDYRNVFEKMLRFGVHGMSPAEIRVLQDNRVDLPKEVRAQSVGTDSAGGYTVPEEFSGEIDKELAIWGPMWDANICRELNTTNGRRISWPTVDDTGNTGRIKSENSAADDDGSDDVTFGEKQFDAYVYNTGIVKVSWELLQDTAFDMEAILRELFGERLGRTANTALTTGSGSGAPNGFVTAANVGKTAAATGAITADELIDLQHSVDAAYRSSPFCRWQFNDTTLGAIRKLKDGDGNYLWQMGDVRVGEPATILGHPYSVNQAIADIGTDNKPVAFGDFSRYVVRKVIGFQVLTLRERYAENFQVGVIGYKRFDGDLLNANAVKTLQNASS